MIPEELREFLSAPRFCALGLVDSQGRPRVVRCGGWYLGAPGGPDLILIARSTFAPVLPGRGASDRIAIFLNEATRYVAYQLKGRGKTRGATPEEVSGAVAMLAALGQAVEESWGLPATLYTSIVVSPAVAIEMTVEEAYIQSPGANAGQRIGGAS